MKHCRPSYTTFVQYPFLSLCSLPPNPLGSKPSVYHAGQSQCGSRVSGDRRSPNSGLVEKSATDSKQWPSCRQHRWFSSYVCCWLLNVWQCSEECTKPLIQSGWLQLFIHGFINKYTCVLFFASATILFTCKCIYSISFIILFFILSLLQTLATLSLNQARSSSLLLHVTTRACTPVLWETLPAVWRNMSESE